MNISDQILKFMEQRPPVEGIIGYGSGVNPQKNQEKRNPQIDLIVLVDNLKDFHRQNIIKNKNDYSFTSRLFFKYAPYKTLKKGARICYMTYIPFEGKEYKIGTIETKDFLNDLNNWETFYMAGRMQKPILIVKADEKVEKAIVNNRINAVNITKIISDKNILEKDFYINLTSLSYMGDTRMGIAENPDKVANIVEGALNFYIDNYRQYLDIKDGYVDLKLNNNKFPSNLEKYLEGKDVNKENIVNFLKEKNKSVSLSQTIKGIFTTGPVKAIKYAKEKLKRKKRK